MDLTDSKFIGSLDSERDDSGMPETSRRQKIQWKNSSQPSVSIASSANALIDVAKSMVTYLEKKTSLSQPVDGPNIQSLVNEAIDKRMDELTSMIAETKEDNRELKDLILQSLRVQRPNN